MHAERMRFTFVDFKLFKIVIVFKEVDLDILGGCFWFVAMDGLAVL